MSSNDKDKEFVVSSENPYETRKYVKVYHDFLESELLNRNEKMLFILLKRYLDFRDDQGGINGTAYPKLETLAKQCGMTEKTVRNTLNDLKKKGIIKVKQRGLNKPNEYIIRDYASVWKSVTEKEAKEEIIRERLKLAEIIAKEYGYSLIKEKEPETTEPTKVQVEPDSNKNQYSTNNTTTDTQNCQEKYAIEDIREIYDYNAMIIDYPLKKNDIDSVIDILYDILNTSKETIKIGNEDKPKNVVIAKMMKLNKDTIIYAIDKFEEQIEHIKNPVAYLTMILYKAPEQFNFYVTNQFRYDMAHD